MAGSTINNYASADEKMPEDNPSRINLRADINGAVKTIRDDVREQRDTSRMHKDENLKEKMDDREEKSAEKWRKPMPVRPSMMWSGAGTTGALTTGNEIRKEMNMMNQYRSELTSLKGFLNTPLSADQRTELEAVVKQFINDVNELRVNYQNTTSTDVVMTKEQWNSEVESLMNSLHDGLSSMIKSERQEKFETFINNKTAMMKKLYEKLELVNKIQLMQKKLIK